MRKRIAIFGGLFALLVASLAIAIAGTGAYFTDQASGTSTAGMGKLRIGDTVNLSAKFDNLFPGQLVKQVKTLPIDASAPVDVYARFHFPAKPDGLTWTDFARFDTYIEGVVGMRNDGWRELASDVRGSSVDFTLITNLDITADNHWQQQSVTVDYDVQIVQAGQLPVETNPPVHD